MDFSPKTLGGQKVKYYDSEEESEIQIVFVPGLFNPEIWKHQIKYFSKNYRTITYKAGSKDQETEVEVLKDILKQPSIDNTVLVGSGGSNSIVQKLEEREDIIATVLTSPHQEYQPISESQYQALKLVWLKNPKLAKKFLLSKQTNYKVAKELLQDLEKPDYTDLRNTITNHDLRSPMKDALVIHPEDDRFSSLEFARSMNPEAKISIIHGAGSFCFYEKPEEYNKAVHDFLKRLEEFVESKKVRETREKNRTLTDFEEKEKSLEEFTDKSGNSDSKETPMMKK